MRITALRRELGWTQARLAAESGVGVRTVQRLEAGADASLETLHLVAVALGVEVGELFAPQRVRTESRPRRRWIAAVAGLAVLGAAGGVVTALQQPTVADASVRAVVSVELRATWTPVTSRYAQQVVASEAEVVTTPLILQEANRRLASPIGAAALARSVTVRALLGSSQLEVSARGPSTSAALERANVLLDALIAEQHALTPTVSDTEVRITRVGRPTTHDPLAAGLLRDGGIGLGGGVAVGLLVLALGARRRPTAPGSAGTIAVA